MAHYWENVVRINDYQVTRFVRTMIQAMFNTIAKKRIVILGFAFKANTGDTRESPAIYVAKKVLEEQAHVIISDPKALANAKIDLADYKEKIEYEKDPYVAVRGAHAIALCTEWDEYRTLDYKKIFSLMEKPAFIFDGRNILDHRSLFEIGFNVFPVGKRPLTHY